ncbi:MAG TPA: 50S ribosomal protein L23 [Chitinophagales bacterium]|jgi:large subunit ribosomal protein L23|nr:50S ribosomal protein L23 [Chitinophagales bacterium]HQV77938.1 50S ribosomal protein L23 [Chitinophagales bacterium]HQW78660.1 50S ribosomal protein L23 [Chitinophagales bacterium]HRB18441.1 50S ribosomal protein L23 [Chitinophagales bacterium]HRB66333.1 50S ribosomal protein L23 [Chitinophagales bacterium]
MEILKKPLITEKASALSEKAGKYTFLVEKKANKVEIKKAVEKMYGVNVEEVNTAIIASKPKNRNTKSRIISGRKSSYKKAIVKVAQGETIDFYNEI